MWAIAKQKMNQDRKLPVWQRLIGLAMAIVLMFCLTACGGDRPVASKAPKAKKIETASISEVSPPQEIQRLNQAFDRYEPQLTIVSPKPDTILQEDKVTVQLSVADLPIFKSSLGLGPHVHVTLDGQDYKPLYNLSESLTFESLSPGTHTLRAFASRPWHESFKNEGAYAQVTFHVYAKTGENTPNPQLPLLTYSRPVGTYGAEPILLDFYLRNAPLHIAALEDSDISDWQIRATVNGQSFLMENWQPLYLKGFKPGKNWVKLEFLDREGNPVANQFNSTVHLIDYQPGGQDALARLMRGEKIADLDTIVDLNYVAPPEPAPLPPQAEPTPPVTTAPTAPVSPQVIKPEPVVPAEPVAPMQPQPSATSAPVEVKPPSVPATKLVTEPETKSEPIQVVPIPIRVAPIPVPVIKQPEVVPVPVNKLPEKLQKKPSVVVTPRSVPEIAAPKPAKPKQEKAKEKKEKSERSSFQKMFDQLKEKVAPKQVEKITPKLPTAVPAIKPEKSVAPQPEATPQKLAPEAKVEPKVNPVPAKPKAKTEEKRARPSFQKMFDQLKAKVAPITEKVKEKVAPKQLGKGTPQTLPTAPAIKPVEKSTPQKQAPVIKVEPKKIEPKVEAKEEAPIQTPGAASKQPVVPDKPKAKTEKKTDRPSFQKMFDQFKEKIAPKPTSPEIAPKQVEQNVPKSAVTTDQTSPKSVPQKLAPLPVMTPKVEPKAETVNNTPKPGSWQERLRQLRQNAEESTSKDSSAPKPARAISIPESL
jgi:hypothetical protein